MGSRDCADLATLLDVIPHAVQRVDDLTRRHVDKIGSPRISRWIEDARFTNYVYDTEEQLALRGSKFGRRRSYLSSLGRRVHSMSRGAVDLAAPGNRAGILAINEAWAASKESSLTIDDETARLQFLLEARPESLFACGVRDEGVLVSFGG